MLDMPKRLRTGKPKVLRRKNVKRRTGAKSQSRQIMALSRQVSSITRRQFASCHTTWQRASAPIDRPAGDQGTAYVCPIPYVPCAPEGAVAGGQSFWTDNLAPTVGSYGKKIVFGLPENAAGSNEIYHTGGVIKWQMTTNEPSLTKYSLFLIRPKKVYADQLAKDRLLKDGSAGAPAPIFGGSSELKEDLDYVVHNPGALAGLSQTYFGAQMNRKYWDVLYRREVTLGTPGGYGGALTDYPEGLRTVDATSGGSKTSISITTGSIKLPAGGIVKLSAVAPQQGGTNASQATSWEVDYGDQTNEAGVYLVCINNGITTDGESANLAMIVHDYYKAVA